MTAGLLNTVLRNIEFDDNYESRVRLCVFSVDVRIVFAKAFGRRHHSARDGTMNITREMTFSQSV